MRESTNFVISHIEQHSKKPDEVRDKIVKLMGDQPRVELFARQQTPGWDVWGNEWIAVSQCRRLDRKDSRRSEVTMKCLMYPVPKDLTKVKTKVAAGLTKRQLICFSLAALVGLPGMFLYPRRHWQFGGGAPYDRPDDALFLLCHV